MRFFGEFKGAKLDLRRYKSALEVMLMRQLHEGVRAWLQVIAGDKGRVPIWSGMARASLLEISRLVNGQIVLSPLKVKSRIGEGDSLGTALQTIDDGKIIIEIITNVPHYNVQEYRKVEGRGSPTAPWRSRDAGMIAFRASIEDLRLLPPTYQPVVIRVS